MIVKKFDLTYKCGMHARPCAALLTLVKPFNAKVIVINSRGQRANASSIIEMLSLGAIGEITFEVEGKDEEKAIETIAGFIHKLNTDNSW
jgi:phosphotransferase system HPr (HPr) family protein